MLASTLLYCERFQQRRDAGIVGHAEIVVRDVLDELEELKVGVVVHVSRLLPMHLLVASQLLGAIEPTPNVLIVNVEIHRVEVGKRLANLEEEVSIFLKEVEETVNKLRKV